MPEVSEGVGVKVLRTPDERSADLRDVVAATPHR
jgi:hypothetical protein